MSSSANELTKAIDIMVTNAVQINQMSVLPEWFKTMKLIDYAKTIDLFREIAAENRRLKFAQREGNDRN